jgi:hypothetical protein
VNALLLLLAAMWVVVVGVAAARAAMSALRLRRTVQTGGEARLDALIALDRRRDRLTERQASLVSSLRLLQQTALGARRGLRVLGILGAALREAAGRR